MEVIDLTSSHSSEEEKEDTDVEVEINDSTSDSSWEEEREDTDLEVEMLEEAANDNVTNIVKRHPVFIVPPNNHHPVETITIDE